jgi:Tfp pilus assembly PilM family ATPase
VNWKHFRRPTPIGVDIGSHTIKAVQAWVERGRIVQVRTAAMARSAAEAYTAEEAAAFDRLLARRGLSGRTLVIGARAKDLRLEPLELPPDTGNLPVHQLAGVELGRIHRLKADTFEHATWGVPAPSRGGAATHVLGVALPHDRGHALADPFLAAGLDVSAVVPEAVSVAALTARIPALAPGHLHTLIDLGWSGTRLLVVRDAALLFQRTLDDTSLQDLQGRLARQLALPAESAAHLVFQAGLSEQGDPLPAGARECVARSILATVQTIVGEIRLTQNYIAHRYQQCEPGRLALYGGGAAVPGFAELLAREARQPVQLMHDADLSLLHDAGPAAGVWVSALAIAFYGSEVRE